MLKSVRQAAIAKSGIATLALAAVCGGATALPALAQVAGGSEHGVGAPLGVDPALLVRPDPVEPPRCIHRAIDRRRDGSLADNRLTIWLTVQRLATATITAGGSASGPRAGTIAITVIRDGVPIANSAMNRGTDFIAANTSAYVTLHPGQQYKFSAKAVVTDKRLDVFDLYVGVGKTCP